MHYASIIDADIMHLAILVQWSGAQMAAPLPSKGLVLAVTVDLRTNQRAWVSRGGAVRALYTKTNKITVDKMHMASIWIDSLVGEGHVSNLNRKLLE